MNERIVCTKCGKEKTANKEFFMMRNHERFPMCKTCLTMFIDNRDPKTFLWILEKFDVPFIEQKWIQMTNEIYQKAPMKFNSGSVIGQYLRLMNMVQYSDYTYADTDRLNAEAERIAQQAAARSAMNSEEAQQTFMELQEQLDRGEIDQAQFNTLNPMNAFDGEVVKHEFIKPIEENEDELLKKFTDEEVQQMRVKWGSLYRPSQWIKMEDLYVRYQNEFELNVDRQESLKQICKVSLKMDEALDVGDVKSYRDLSNTFALLRKDAKFTEAQNKEESTQFLNSIGQLVKYCEQEGGIIPQLPSPDEYPQDKIDITIADMKKYTRTLVKEELNLGDLIESYVKRLEEAEEARESEEHMLDHLNEDEEANYLTDDDYADFADYEARIQAETDALFEGSDI